jgi:choice-of-anchor B domain-containing protein
VRTSFIIFTIIVALCNSNFVSAHAEKGKALFVANSGHDKGDCSNRFRPCRTIAYAAVNAEKGDRILVAKGSYNTGVEYLVNELVPAFGGYNQLDNFQQQSPDQHPTFLTGVPIEYATQLTEKGFNVIRDFKSSDTAKAQNKISEFARLKSAKNTQDCVNGFASQFPCSNISLISQLPLSSFSGQHSSANDIWGHIDLNTGKEYALMGLQKGTAVIDLSEPETPAVVGIIGGQSAFWRDIKVYQFYHADSASWKAYAYVTTDNVANEGIAIIDLSQLAMNQINLVTKQSIDNSAHNIYISGVDYGLNIATEGQTPLVHILGAEKNGGAMRSYNLDNPELLSSEFDASGMTRSDYSHDATSLLVNDERNNQCPDSNDNGCLVMVDFNEQQIHLWDQTRPDARNKLSSFTYQQADYVHSGWWTEDKNYIFVHDEGDERQYGINTTVHIFDITDLNAPRHVTAWRGPTKAVDHNGFVLGNRYYMSNYTRGLTILDISDPENPTEAGFFDTYPSSNSNLFQGAWGAYPYLPSGLVLVSDSSTGLYILQDNTVNNTQNTVGFSAKTFDSTEGSEAAIEVRRMGDSSDTLTVSYQTLPGSASLEDFKEASGTLTWMAGNNDVQFISIDITPDQNDKEFKEQFFVRLLNPKDGATLTANNLATVNISGLKNSGVLAYSSNTMVIRENQSSVAVTVNRNGGSEGMVSVDYELVSQSAIASEDLESAAGTLTWEDGDINPKTIDLTVIDDNLTESEETIELRLTANGDAQVASANILIITIRDDESNLDPTAQAGEDAQYNVRQTVSLSGTGQDQDNDALSYLWSQVSGSNVTLQQANENNASFVAPNTASTLEFRLTVTDEFGAQSTDNIVITVVAAATPPASSDSGGGSFSYLLLCIGMLCIYRRKKLSAD